MTKLSYTKNNLIHTIEGNKDDILAELIDIVTDDMTIIIDDLVTIKTSSKSSTLITPAASSSKKKRRTPRYGMPRNEYKNVHPQVIEAWNTNQYTYDQIYRMFPKVAKSTLRNWINANAKATSRSLHPSVKRSVKPVSKPIVPTSQIKNSPADTLKNILSKEN
jgi:hypothetical protein